MGGRGSDRDIDGSKNREIERGREESDRDREKKNLEKKLR